ncbi:MAG: hypothetical protein NTW46_01895, partial [Candidatus Nealsonbacteria bacterium]|nr:hypothetical protein [Candidatus Nealsonbacteria bacterium]
MPRHKFPEKNFKWNADLAYIIGLITTDGCLSKDGRHIAMRSSEPQLLETFKKCLKISNKISTTRGSGFTNNDSYIVQFGDVQFYRWLLKIGLFPCKTYTIGKIEIPDKYFRDFLRGHLDGDGSVWTYKDRWNTFKNPKYVYDRIWVRFMSASRKHMEWLEKRINKLFLLKGHSNERKPTRNDQTTSMWELKFAKKESVKLLSNLYYS